MNFGPVSILYFLRSYGVLAIEKQPACIEKPGIKLWSKIYLLSCHQLLLTVGLNSGSLRMKEQLRIQNRT